MKLQFADRIRMARRAAGLSQSNVAELLLVHRGTVGHWERGAGHLPTSANLLALATAMGTSYEWLATGRGSMQVSNDNEPSAVRLDCFAWSVEEEQLLLAFREISSSRQAKILDFARSLGRQVDPKTVAPLAPAPAPASTHLRAALSVPKRASGGCR